MGTYRTGDVRVACYPPATLTPGQIKQLRADLRCTARDLATTLDVPLAEIQSWESGERFPTKQWVDRMDALRDRGPDGVIRKARRATRAQPSAMEQLDNPELWLLLRKLIAHPSLFAETVKLSAKYDDPAV